MIGQRKYRRRYCLWCRRPLDAVNASTALSMTRDHVVPKAIGGQSTRPCCLACNQLKGDMTPWQWDRFREVMPDWWRLYPDVKYRGVRLYAYVVEGLTPISKPRA